MGVSLRCASGRRAAGYAIAAVLRCATHCSRTLRMPHAKQLLDVLPCFYIYVCFTLFEIDYQILTKLNFFILFEVLLFYFVLHSFSSMYKVKS
ncbi:MAG: hypothetical protein NZ455_04950 [Bacteroidia bacterium]|nr:hypothetical protein [Bacteroidia bacterium]MDW8345745.1 hypothetical protein [Bacteroidia bacterium]